MSDNDSRSYNAFLPTVKPEWRQGVVAIGNFDGVHKGHQALLQRGRAIADQAGQPFIVLTFAPHPRAYFQPHGEPFLLMQPDTKLAHLHAQGADGVVVVPFTEPLSKLSANDFIRFVLEDGLAAKHIVVGQNFVFGHGRQGHVETLLAHGFDVTALAPVTRMDGTIYSSTAVRQAILNHDLADATDLLGHAWSITGTVITGDQRGRTIGFPTANIAWPDMMLRPTFGVYGVNVTLPNGSFVRGIANIGLRPTVSQDVTQPMLEVHLFDFDGDLYGQDLTVEFDHFIRLEQKFGSLNELKAKIQQDCQAILT